MITVSNVSLQGFELYLQTEQGVTTYWLSPKEYLTVPNKYLTPQIQTLVKRRLLRLQEAV